MHKIFLALGSNVGDKKAHIAKAIELLSEKITNIKPAPLYFSKAMYYEKQDDFVNSALSGETDLSPEELLKFVKGIEQKVGRVKRFHWGPREIDIDILFYDDLVLKNETLEIPHPRLHERDFVLIPLMELDPNFVHPVLKKTIKELLEQISEESQSVLTKNI